MNFEAELLSIENLSVGFDENPENAAVKNLQFTIHKGETLGIVGESGSGKSLTSLAIMGLLPTNAKIHSGQINYFPYQEGANLLQASEPVLRKIRGKQIAMIFQEPMTSLNPVHTCGHQVLEAIRLHQKLGKKASYQRVIELFEAVKLPRPDDIFNSYPHQISGGQKQRVMIAMALSCDPAMIIADEPTTALDVTVQKEILKLLAELCEKNGTGLIFITHDLGVVAEVANRVLIMYRGQIVEQGFTKSIFQNPSEPYTKALIECRPRLDKKPYRLPVVSDFLEKEPDEGKAIAPDGPAASRSENLLEVKGLNIWFASKKDWKGKPTAYVHAVNGVSFEVKKGETLGLVGESGCGKTTLGRSLVKLVEPQSGKVHFEGQNILGLSQAQFKPLRKKIQLIFQDPYASLNPRLSIEQALIEPMKVHKLGTIRDRKLKARQMLNKVGLPATALPKYPHEFSGGQRQRICIARALVAEPEFIICDESVSALDVSVQAQVLNLLNDLKEEFGLTYIFISHDLSVVKYMSDRLVVMRRGKIEEIGAAERVYTEPKSKYTSELISAIPEV